MAVITGLGHRVWVAWTQEAVVLTPPTPAPGESTVLVPRRLVEFASRLGHLDGEATLEVGEDRLSVESESGSLTIDRPSSRPMPDLSRVGGTPTTARVPADVLHHLLQAGQDLPAGVDLESVPAPLFWVGVRPGHLTVDVDWSLADVPAVHLRARAVTDGPAVSVPLSPSVLPRLVGFARPDEEVRMAIPASRRRLLVATEGWTAHVTPVDLSCEAWRPEVHALLLRCGLPVSSGPDGSWALDVDGTEVLVALRDGTPNHVRATVVLATGVPGSPDVLTEVQHLSAGLVGVRVWWDTGALVAGLDVPCSLASRLLVGSLSMLAGQVQDLGPLVAALGDAA